MASSSYSGKAMFSGVTAIRKKHLGARKTCLRSIRGVFVSTFNVCDIILNHFEKKISKHIKNLKS